MTSFELSTFVSLRTITFIGQFAFYSKHPDLVDIRGMDSMYVLVDAFSITCNRYEAMYVYTCDVRNHIWEVT